MDVLVLVGFWLCHSLSILDDGFKCAPSDVQSLGYVLSPIPQHYSLHIDCHHWRGGWCSSIMVVHQAARCDIFHNTYWFAIQHNESEQLLDNGLAFSWSDRSWACLYIPSSSVSCWCSLARSRCSFKLVVLNDFYFPRIARRCLAFWCFRSKTSSLQIAFWFSLLLLCA